MLKLADNLTKSFQHKKGFLIAFLSILFGILIIILFAFQASNITQYLSIVGVASMISLAALLFGGLIGFLFGIPRKLQQDQVNGDAEETNNNATGEQNGRPSYQTNTNLEQISDWLTKILVGVGLTQMTKIPDLLGNFAIYAASGLGDFPSSKIFSLALLIYFSIGGFLISYLVTRLNLLSAFVQADLDARFAKVESEVSEFQKKVELDAKALTLVQKQLNPVTDAESISQEQLNNIINTSSSKAKQDIFYKAQEVRANNWRDRQTKPKMEKTIPVFRALIASDVDDIYHMNHGQLGFALKDKRKPDWKEAEAELTKAIELRGDWREKGWLFYEFNRAICNINLDGNFLQKKKSDEPIKTKILDDIKNAANASELKLLIKKDKLINEWLTLNSVSL